MNQGVLDRESAEGGCSSESANKFSGIVPVPIVTCREGALEINHLEATGEPRVTNEKDTKETARGSEHLKQHIQPRL
jgi:hypothetical protein